MPGYDIYYDGSYWAVISASVQLALTTYFASFDGDNFNGTLKLSTLETVLLSVPGVKDVVARQVEIRPASVSPTGATQLVNDYQTLFRQYGTYAGYIVADTASGRTLNDVLNLIPA